MALREVKPFDKQQMEKLQANMKRGATEKQVKNFAEAQEYVKKANITRNF